MAYFDSQLYSEPLAIMNLLWDFENSKMKGYFCNKFNVSFPRLQRLKTSRDSLIARVAKYLKKNSQDLHINLPPRDLSYKKITLLQFIQVYLFHDSIVEWNSKTFFSLESNGLISLQLKSSEHVKEDHIYQLLDRNKHPISLEVKEDSILSGHFEPTIIDGEPYFLGYEDFEERLLSLGLEKGSQCIFCCYQGLISSLYVLIEKRDLIESNIKKYFQSNEIVYCFKKRNSKRGWKSRECGVYTFQHKDVVNDADADADADANVNADDYDDKVQDKTQKILVKYFNYYSNIKEMKQKKRLVKTQLNNMELNSLSVIIDVPNIRKNLTSWNVTCRGGPRVTLQNLKDLMASPNVTIGQEDGQTHQTITFHEAPSKPTNSSIHHIFQNAPEGMRILSAVAAASRGKPKILFPKLEKEESEQSFYEVRLRDNPTRQRWKQYSSYLSVYVSETSYPASVVPLNNVDVCACCANSLLLRGGALKVEGLTILPFGGQFVSLVKKCLGMESSNFHLGSDMEELADQFFTMYSQHKDKPLCCLKNETAMLFNLFNLLRKNYANQTDQTHSESKTNGILEAETNIDNSVIKNEESNDFQESITFSPNKDTQSTQENDNNINISNQQERCKLDQQEYANDDINVESHLSCQTGGKQKLRAGIINGKYICFFCNNKVPFSWDEFKSHLKKAHNFSNMENIQIPTHTEINCYYCLMCGAETLNQKEFYRHALEKHNVVQLSAKKYRCLHCRAKPFTRHQLEKHLKKVHNITPSNKKRYIIPYFMLGD